MMPIRPRSTRFDPEGKGYDELSASMASMKRDKKGHLGSRSPVTGQMLKGRKHKSYGLAVKGEKEAGYEIYKDKSTGIYYSRKKEKGFYGHMSSPSLSKARKKVRIKG